MLAQTRGQRRGAAPNPFEIAGMVKSYQDMMRPSGGYSLSSDTEDNITGGAGGGRGMTNKDLKRMLSAAGWAQTTGLQGLMGNSGR